MQDDFGSKEYFLKYNFTFKHALIHYNVIPKVKENKLSYTKMIYVKFYTRYLYNHKIFICLFCHNEIF